MRADRPPAVITVGGTNGKGSACRLLEAMLGHAGYRVGTYTSPHLLRYNERVCIGGREAGDEALVAGFAAVERARAAGAVIIGMGNPVSWPSLFIGIGSAVAAAIFCTSCSACCAG